MVARGGRRSQLLECPRMKTGEALIVVAWFGMEVARAEGAPAVPAPNASVAVPHRERAISPRSAALLKAAMPKFEPVAAVAPEPPPRRPASRDVPTNGVIRLPNYIVREPKLPTWKEVEKAEVARRAMEQYLGPENGLDRGLLNLITSKQFPILALIGSTSNEARAMARYREDERLRLKADLIELAALTKQGGDAAGAAKIKRQVQDVFRTSLGTRD